MKLINIINSIFRKKYERDYDNPSFKSCFYRFIGVEDGNDYDNLLKTIETRMKEYEKSCILFDGSIEMSGEMELIQYIYNELGTMDIFNMKYQDITIFNDRDINLKFLEGLDYVIPLAIQKENFFNDSVRNNFITKLIVWVYVHLREIDFEGDIIPKGIYYGEIGKHEIYFLMLMNKMGFDIVYINPLKETLFKEVNTESELIENMGILSIETFKDRAKNGKVIEAIETNTKVLQREIEGELFNVKTGMYKPWQFRGGYTKAVVIDSILEDIYTYFNEPAKLRVGFEVEKDTVKVPCMFFKIDGQYDDIFKYQKLIKFCTTGENVLFLNGRQLSNNNAISEDMYGVMFHQLSNGEFDIEGIKKLKRYRFSKYSTETQNFLLKKFNEAITRKDVYVKEFKEKQILRLLVLVLELNNNVLRLIDNFDFTGNVPKVVIFIEREKNLSEEIQLILGYLHIIGFDIIIFNPSGLFNLNNVLQEKIVISERLEIMKYDTMYRTIMSVKEGFFSRLLK
ncbi:MAG: YceG family protein [Clostridium sp.]|uniref:YceG family protein n=1 Tax=Clostridium sp. TaxID=1506 RepID=UPI003F2B781F